MIYQKLIITDQSYEVSCQDISFVPCPMRFSCPAEKINLLAKIGVVKMFAVAGYHAVVCDAFISLIYHSFSFFLSLGDGPV